MLQLILLFLLKKLPLGDQVPERLPRWDLGSMVGGLQTTSQLVGGLQTTNQLVGGLQTINHGAQIPPW